MSFESLQDRLSALQETTSQLQDLISRLACLKFQPGSVPLDASPESTVAAELGAEISQILREEEEDLELLAEEIADLRPTTTALTATPRGEAGHAKARLEDGVRRAQADLARARVTFRGAQLAARRSLEAAQRLERSLLLASYHSATAAPSSESGRSSPAAGQLQHQQLFPAGYRPARRKNQQGQDEKGDLIHASSSVTAALRRTHALISSELSRSRFAQQTLAESTAALEALQHHYAGLDDLLQSSRDLLGTLLTSNKSDTWYLETAFWMLAATLAWLVFRRWVYGPAWWLLWLPLRTAWGAGRGAVGMLSGGRGAGEVEVGEVRGTEGARVGGFDEHGTVAVPTVRTGREEEKAAVDEDSMVEKVGRMVDEIELQVGEGLAGGDERESGRADGNREAGENQSGGTDAPNPMKRMWEEDKEALKEASREARIRDEL